MDQGDKTCNEVIKIIVLHSFVHTGYAAKWSPCSSVDDVTPRDGGISILAM